MMDAELDEGAIWGAVAGPQVASLGERLWVVELNRQSLDRVVPDIQIERLQGMLHAAGRGEVYVYGGDPFKRVKTGEVNGSVS